MYVCATFYITFCSVVEENGAKRVAEVSRELEQIKEHNASLLAQLTTFNVCILSVLHN